MVPRERQDSLCWYPVLIRFEARRTTLIVVCRGLHFTIAADSSGLPRQFTTLAQAVEHAGEAGWRAEEDGVAHHKTYDLEALGVETDLDASMDQLKRLREWARLLTMHEGDGDLGHTALVTRFFLALWLNNGVRRYEDLVRLKQALRFLSHWVSRTLFPGSSEAGCVQPQPPRLSQLEHELVSLGDSSFRRGQASEQTLMGSSVRFADSCRSVSMQHNELFDDPETNKRLSEVLMYHFVWDQPVARRVTHFGLSSRSGNDTLAEAVASFLDEAVAHAGGEGLAPGEARYNFLVSLGLYTGLDFVCYAFETMELPEEWWYSD